MPQLDFSVFPSQLFWLVLCFLTMLFIFSKLIIPKTAEMINLRKEKIDGDLEKAEKIKQQVEAALEKYNQALAEASAKAQTSLQKTKDELNSLVLRRQEDLNTQLKAQINAGERAVSLSREKALQKLEEASADLAVVVLKKLGFAGIDKKDALNTIKALKKD